MDSRECSKLSIVVLQTPSKVYHGLTLNVSQQIDEDIFYAEFYGNDIEDRFTVTQEDIEEEIINKYFVEFLTLQAGASET